MGRTLRLVPSPAAIGRQQARAACDLDRMAMDTHRLDSFARRHIGPRGAAREAMLRAVGVTSLDQLVDEAIPAAIRLTRPLRLPEAETEAAFLARLRGVAARNRTCRSFLGLGYYDCVTPSAIVRNVIENPGWYTPYTPYQAEIAQGRLEALLTFQTVVRDLTGMEVANASLLDEPTAAAEAMAMLHRVSARQGPSANVFLVADTVWPHTIDVLRGRAEPLGLDVRVLPAAALEFGPDVFGTLLQYPDGYGRLHDLEPIIAAAHAAGARVAVATDLLALTLLTPPGEMGADVVVGSAQRFGVPMGYGGPHAAFFATRDAFVRQVPGRIIGVSVDAGGQPALRMALQTREQHIRREKATSNICTAQALLASIAAFYAVYHGPDGLAGIARQVHEHAAALSDALALLGVEERNRVFFDTLRLSLPAGTEAATGPLRAEADAAGLNFRYLDDGTVGVALDETVTEADVSAIVECFSRACGQPRPVVTVRSEATRIPPALARRSSFLTHEVFHAHRSETQMMRYLRRLERKDVGLDTSMIPLGSCTMKLNAASEMLPLTWPEFARPHPFAPHAQTAGYQQVFRELEAALCEITGLAAVSLQPNSGAQGELAGLLVIRAWHRSRGDGHRRVVLIPSSAHGTNPASAVMAGMDVVVVACDAQGNIDLADLEAKAKRHERTLAALMVTYPSTHGVFEEGIRAICETVHACGGQVYMDGANMNAQVGLTSPARIGADVCHLNLHKTFSIPHGGGGPGMGPIAVASHLAPFLPRHPLVAVGGPAGIGPVAGAPWGSANILLISYAYICMLGADGMTEATRHAILNANYLKARLEPHFPVLYARPNGRVAHELIFDVRPLRQASGIDEIDIAKRLVDYGFHAPTVSFPVPGTLMVEPTESESADELDRFCEAMVAIRGEIQEVIDGRADRRDNVLKHAPHTAAALTATEWPHAYSREQAAYPVPSLRSHKFWPPVGRIDNAYGDRHLVCACVPTAAYATEPVGA
jgi:glycine dehydrogenase